MDNQVMEGLQAEINFSDKLNGKLEPQKDKPSMQITMRPYYLTIFLGSTAASLRDCVQGEMNEWEVTVYAKVVLRAASVVRAYINRASTDFFEQVFDELQRVKLLVTGRPIPLKRFVPGGNLQVMNADMDGAQIIGICRSVMKHNVPEYRKIPNDTPPEQVAPEFIKICWQHSKEPVHDFKSLVSSADYERLLDFVYIDSKEALDAFSAFVKCLGIKKIQALHRQRTQMRLNTSASSSAAADELREEEESSSSSESETGKSDLDNDEEQHPELLEQEACSKEGDVTVDSIIVADEIAEWVETVLEDTAPLDPSELASLAADGLKKARKSKDYRSTILFAALTDFYRWMPRMGRLAAALRVAKNHGHAFQHVLCAQARFFEANGALKPSHQGRRQK
ncbi:hypothetical protein B0H10DRAFT_1951537 [Mycena sp. CBHHK59/15]|nr:hypothetical protein B0H10DRAFT_1951537 [Mycena sp. CBHHK59/15]